MFNATLSRAFPVTPSADSLAPVLLSSPRPRPARQQQQAQQQPRAPLFGLGISWDGVGASEALQGITGLNDASYASYDLLTGGSGLQAPFMPTPPPRKSFSGLDRAFDGLCPTTHYAASTAESVSSMASMHSDDDEASRAPSTAPSSVASPRSPPQQQHVDCGRFLVAPAATPAHSRAPSPSPSHATTASLAGNARSLGTRERLETRLRGLAIDVECASASASASEPVIASSGLGIGIGDGPAARACPSSIAAPAAVTPRRRRSPSSPAALETSFAAFSSSSAADQPLPPSRRPSHFAEGAELKWLRREAYLLIPLRVTSSPRPTASRATTTARGAQEARGRTQAPLAMPALQRTGSLPPPAAAAAMARRRMPSARFHPYGLAGASSASPFTPPSTVPAPTSANANATRPWDL